MKKKILFIMFIAASLTIAALMSGCPTNIQAGDYCIYTINGVVKTIVGENRIPNIQIEVKKYLIEETKDTSADKNVILQYYIISRGDTSPDTIQNNDNTPDPNPTDTTPDPIDKKNPSPDENPVLASCISAKDGSFSLSFKFYLPSEDQTSDKDDTFYLYATDEEGIHSIEKPISVNFNNTGKTDDNNVEITDGNPYGSYHSKSKKIHKDIEMN